MKRKWHSLIVLPCLALAQGCQRPANDAAIRDTGRWPPAVAVCMRPAEPPLPDGKTASEDRMKATQAEIVLYAETLNAYRHCLSDEINATGASYQAFGANWVAQEHAYLDAHPKGQDHQK